MVKARSKNQIQATINTGTELLRCGSYDETWQYRRTARRLLYRLKSSSIDVIIKRRGIMVPVELINMFVKGHQLMVSETVPVSIRGERDSRGSHISDKSTQSNSKTGSF